MILFIITVCNLFFLFMILDFYNVLLVSSEKKDYINYIAGIVWVAVSIVSGNLSHHGLLNAILNLNLFTIMTISYEKAPVRKAFLILLTESVFIINDKIIIPELKYYCVPAEKISIVMPFIAVIIYFSIEMVSKLLYNRFRRIKAVPRGLFTLIFTHVNSLIIIVCIALSDIEIKYLMITELCASAMCFTVFFLYSIILTNQMREYEYEKFKQQMDAYKCELTRISESTRRIEGIKHDLKHHIIEIRNLVEKNKKKELIEYVNSINKDICSDIPIAHSGKYEIDSLVNYMLGNARSSLNNVDVNIIIPEDVEIERYHLNIILGNLLENAICAALRSEKKYLYLEMKVQRGILFITIKNSFSGKLLRDGEIMKSTKSNKLQHGFGLNNVKRIVEERDGYINIETEDDIFNVDLMIYL